MKRRGFLAFMGAAPIAGPQVMRQVAAETVSDLGIGALGVAADAAFSPAPAPTVFSIPDAVTRLTKLGMRSAAEHAFHRSRQGVWGLDPDLASYRSMSLSARIEMQRARNYERTVREESDWLGAIVKGWVS